MSRPQLSRLIVEGDYRRDPALTKCSLGFNSHLLLGSPRVEEWQKRYFALDPLLSNSAKEWQNPYLGCIPCGLALSPSGPNRFKGQLCAALSDGHCTYRCL